MSAIGNDAAPNNGTSGNEGNNTFNFEQGYNELRPEYTRVTQELGTYRERLTEYEQLFEALHDADPEVQSAAMQALGLELETGPQGNPDDFVDPLEEAVKSLSTRFDRLESARELEASERNQREILSLRDDYIGEAIGFIEKSMNRKFTERQEEALGNLAISMPNGQGVPDVEAAYNLLYGDQGVVESEREQWIARKMGADRPPLGTSIPADQRPKTAAERIAYMDERMRAHDQQY